MSDKEQIQLLKNWWKQYGTSILVGILAFAVVNFGWQYWNQNKSQRTERASLMYTQLLNIADQDKNSEALLFEDHLIKDYASTPYASLAALSSAKNAVVAGKLEVALDKLQWVIKNSNVAGFRELARIRAARILLEQKKPQEALDLLAKIDDSDFAAAIDEVSGDALVALGKNDLAKERYQKAQQLSNGDAVSPFLKMKSEK